MKFKEAINKSNNFHKGMITQRLGTGSFPTGTERKEDQYPHDLMKQAMRAYETRPIITAGVDQLSLLITGGNMFATGEDEEEVKRLQQWLDYRENLQNEVIQLSTYFLVTGNVPVEPGFKFRGEKYYIDNFNVFQEPYRVYRSLYAYDKNNRNVDSLDSYWLVEVSETIRTIEEPNGKKIRPQYYWITYSPYEALPEKWIYAIPLHKEKFKYLQSPYKKWGFYSYSFVMSVLNNVEAMYNIIQNVINITKYKAIGKSVVQVGDKDNPATPQDVDRIQHDLANGQFDNLVTNKPVDKKSLSYEGDYNTLERELDWLRKEVSSGLTPNFLTGFTDEVNRATSTDIKIVLQEQLQVWRRMILNFLNENIMPSIREELRLSKDTRLDFENIDLFTPKEKVDQYRDLYSDNAITLNEYRKKLGFDTVENGDVFKDQLEDQLKQSGGGGSSFSFSYEPEGQEFSEKPIKQDKVHGHTLTLEQKKDHYMVLDGKEILLETDDKQTAQTYLQNYKKKLKEDNFTTEDPLEEEKETIKHISGHVKDMKKDIEKILDSKKATREAKIFNTDVIKPLHDKIDNAFGNMTSVFNKSLGSVFKRSKDAVLNEVTRAKKTKDYDTSKIKPINAKDLRIDAANKYFSNDFKSLKSKKKQEIEQLITDSHVAGIPHSKIKKQVMEKVDDVHHEAERKVRTNVGRLQVLSKLKLYKQMGVEKFVWRTHIDERTREAHRKRNNKVYSIDKALNGNAPAPTMVRDNSGKWIPSENINCRCSVKPYYG